MTKMLHWVGRQTSFAFPSYRYSSLGGRLQGK